MPVRNASAVPWYPYPHKSVAELDAPAAGKTTSWDFTDVLPQLADFMSATYGKNHSTVINFSTQPCWLFGNAQNQTQNCSYPSNPDQSFFGYVRGDRANLLDPTAKTMADYYSRLLAWLVVGEFTDEHGTVHSGGPKYDLSRANGHVWELFNEAEHRYDAQQYTHDFDVIVPAMIEAVGGYDKAPAFMGIGGASPTWIPYFLNASSHTVPRSQAPIDYISIHFYAGCSNRTDPSTYSSGFFGRASSFVDSMRLYVAERDASSFPDVKIDCDELGVIMPDDNAPGHGITGDLPDIYWNAAGAMYAFLFLNLAPMGVEVLGHSQLAGSPEIPDWGIPLSQFPSVSLLDWRTGFGNARYWALKILIEEFAAGDQFVQTTVTGGTPAGACSSGKPANPLCGTVTSPYAPVTLQCCGTGATIKSVDFADWGTPSGSCGSFHSDPKCTYGPAKVQAWVDKLCLGKQSCTLDALHALGDPCYQVYKTFAAQVECSTPEGGVATSTGPTTPGVVALGVIGSGTHAAAGPAPKKVLLINTQNSPQSVTIGSGYAAGTKLSLRIVDPVSVQVASEKDGIRSDSAIAGTAFTLNPFAIVVASDQ